MQQFFSFPRFLVSQLVTVMIELFNLSYHNYLTVLTPQWPACDLPLGPSPLRSNMQAKNYLKLRGLWAQIFDSKLLNLVWPAIPLDIFKDVLQKEYLSLGQTSLWARKFEENIQSQVATPRSASGYTPPPNQQWTQSNSWCSWLIKRPSPNSVTVITTGSHPTAARWDVPTAQKTTPSTRLRRTSSAGHCILWTWLRRVYGRTPIS